jgi:hypothetical protein
MYSVGAGNLVDVCKVCLHVKFRFHDPVNVPDVTALVDQMSLTISADGIRSSVITTGFTIGVVIGSSADNIDYGELMIIPPIPALATDYETLTVHNGLSVDYSLAGDQGVVTVVTLFQNK